MAIGETVVLSFVAALCLLFAWAIGRHGEVDLIAGYRSGQYPPDRERELAADMRNLLLVVTGLLVVQIVDAWTGLVPRAGTLLVVVTAGLLGWIAWKHNVKYDSQESSEQ